MVQRRTQKEIRKHFGLKENENTMCGHIWGTAEAVHMGKFIAVNVCMRKEERSQVKGQASILRKKEKKNKPRVSKRKGINIRA